MNRISALGLVNEAYKALKKKVLAFFFKILSHHEDFFILFLRVLRALRGSVNDLFSRGLSGLGPQLN